jgi:hypothetical protein
MALKEGVDVSLLNRGEAENMGECGRAGKLT